MPTPPTVLALAVRPARDVPCVRVPAARATKDGGLEGDHGGRGDRGVTLLSREAWAEACEEAGADLPWTTRRANVLVEGIALASLVGRRLRLGEVEVAIAGETRPCEVMDRAWRGLRRALEPAGRGGAHGRVVVGGVLRVGDAVALLGEA